MFAVTNTTPVLCNLSEYNDVLAQKIQQYDPKGDLVTMTFLNALYNNAEQSAKSLLGRVTETYTQFYQSKNKEGLADLLKQYQEECGSLRILITQANDIAQQLLEMKFNDNSPPSQGAARIVTKNDIQEESDKITSKARYLEATYCTESNQFNRNWYLADYMAKLGHMAKPETE